MKTTKIGFAAAMCLAMSLAAYAAEGKAKPAAPEKQTASAKAPEQPPAG